MEAGGPVVIISLMFRVKQESVEMTEQPVESSAKCSM